MWIWRGYLKKVVVITYLSHVTIYRFGNCVVMFYAIYLFLFFSLCPFLCYTKNYSGGLLHSFGYQCALLISAVTH